MMDFLPEDVKFRRYMIGHTSVSILAQTRVIFPSISRKESEKHQIQGKDQLPPFQQVLTLNFWVHAFVLLSEYR